MKKAFILIISILAVIVIISILAVAAIAADITAPFGKTQRAASTKPQHLRVKENRAYVTAQGWEFSVQGITNVTVVTPEIVYTNGNPIATNMITNVVAKVIMVSDGKSMQWSRPIAVSWATLEAKFDLAPAQWSLKKKIHRALLAVADERLSEHQ